MWVAIVWCTTDFGKRMFIVVYSALIVESTCGLNCAQNGVESSDVNNLTRDEPTGMTAAIGRSPVIDYLSRCVIVNCTNCSLLDAENRCRQAMRQTAQRRTRLVRELAMLCPPLTVYGPASTSAAEAETEADPYVWNHASTCPFDAVDVISPSVAARLTSNHVQLIGDHTLGDGTPPDRLTSMLRETAKRYSLRELDLFAAEIVPALFDILAARQYILISKDKKPRFFCCRTNTGR